MAEQPLRYGLVAEEVAEVFPTLVSYDEDGQPVTVRYELLTPLLLNEVQQQADELAALRDTVADLRQRLERLTKRKRPRAR